MAETKTAGIAAEDVLERSAGGEYHRALALVDLDNAAYVVEEEFAYETSGPGQDLLRLVGDLRAHLARLSIVEETAELTLSRVCPRCGGEGSSLGEDVCADCGGSGDYAPGKDG